MKKFFLLLGLTLIMFIVFAHEYVLLAAKYHLHKNEFLELHLFVSDGFNIQLERPFQKGITKAFELITNDNRITNLQGADSAMPISNTKEDFDGGGLIHLERNYSRISLPTSKFLNYLIEDYINGIANKVDGKKGQQTERYTRYLKCLVQSGNSFKDTLYKKIVGQNFEIILLQNPYLLHKDEKLSAQILFKGKPLRNKIITARNRMGSAKTIAVTAKTNQNGICTFTLVRNGEWFIHATHMIPSPDKTDSDWESFWASYSFGMD